MDELVTACYSINSCSKRLASLLTFLFGMIILQSMLATPAQGSSNLPVAEKPRTFIDTTYHHPAGRTIFVGERGDLKTALNTADPGDTIVLQAGAVFIGNFAVPVKENPNKLWIYVESSALPRLPAPGHRIDPATDAANMPKVVTPNANPAFLVPNGAGYVRFVGIEMYSASTYLANSNHKPWPINGFGYYLVQGMGATNVTIDRCFIHGSDTQDVNHAAGFGANSSYIAVVDSDIRDIHGGRDDSQAFLAWASPGPFKVVDNYLSASTEDVMFGGAGGYRNPYVPSDIEIRNNHLYKPESWIPMTTGTRPWKWGEKNNFECKACLRLVFTGNTLENSWNSAQYGSSVLMQPLTSQSGMNSVNDDIDIEDNVMLNANFGFSILGFDPFCHVEAGCTNPGESKRVVIKNNLIKLRDPAAPSAYNPTGFSIGRYEVDYLIQHNTIVGMNGSQPKWSFFFLQGIGCGNVSAESLAFNFLILDNVLPRQITGNCGFQGQKALDSYIPNPNPIGTRFIGNIMFIASGDRSQTFPKGNTSTAKLTFKDSATGNFGLLSSQQVPTTDGPPAGVDMSRIKTAMAMQPVAPADVQPEVAMLQSGERMQFHSARGSMWRLAPNLGTISSDGLYTAPPKVEKLSGITICRTDPGSPDSCASIVVVPTRTPEPMR